jgi:hypothetical protein
MNERRLLMRVHFALASPHPLFQMQIGYISLRKKKRIIYLYIEAERKCSALQRAALQCGAGCIMLLSGSFIIIISKGNTQ